MCQHRWRAAIPTGQSCSEPWWCSSWKSEILGTAGVLHCHCIWVGEKGYSFENSSSIKECNLADTWRTVNVQSRDYVSHFSIHSNMIEIPFYWEDTWKWQYATSRASVSSCLLPPSVNTICCSNPGKLNVVLCWVGFVLFSCVLFWRYVVQRPWTIYS